MAGYSGTPLLKKLGIQESSRVLLINPPSQLPQELQAFAASRSKKNLDVAVVFADSIAMYKAGFASMMHAIHPDGAIWIAWPKKASGIRTNLTENLVRSHALTTPFVDVKVCAIDEIWSGLKLVIRKELRAEFAVTSEARKQRWVRLERSPHSA